MPGSKCPICKKPVEQNAEDFPFCSERCRLLDLGKWASGQYVISSPLQDTDDGGPDDHLRTDDEE
ncbi:MAG: DNA gyrase inhibitor YacG [Acidobacteria bacterium]|nr:MAG: DNA gyrase inhibitor YacG [Acidobacteriota bacterium]